jgi:hypothetical protein
MKRITAPRSRVVTLLVLAALVLVGVATVTASAGTRRGAAAPTPACSIASVAGAWGHNFDGWVNLGVLTPFAGAGRTAVDGQGNVSGTETRTPLFGGRPIEVTMTGTVTVNADCSGTLTVNLYDQSNALIGTEVWAVVYVDNETAMRGTLATLNSSFGINIPNASATLNADKLFPATGQ